MKTKKIINLTIVVLLIIACDINIQEPGENYEDYVYDIGEIEFAMISTWSYTNDTLSVVFLGSALSEPRVIVMIKNSNRVFIKEVIEYEDAFQGRLRTLSPGIKFEMIVYEEPIEVLVFANHG